MFKYFFIKQKLLIVGKKAGYQIRCILNFLYSWYLIENQENPVW